MHEHFDDALYTTERHLTQELASSRRSKPEGARREIESREETV